MAKTQKPGKAEHTAPGVRNASDLLCDYRLTGFPPRKDTLSMVTYARVILAVVALSAAVSAQPKPKPNFSGRWVVVSPEKGAGQEQIVKHDEKSLSTEHGSEGKGHRMIYQLDGIERRNAIPSHGNEIAMLSKAVWDADRIVITTNTSYPNGMKTQAREVWSLDAKGRLVIDYTETGPTGPGPVVKVIYVKK